MSLNTGSQEKGSTITIVPKIDVAYPTLAPNIKIKKVKDTSIDYGFTEIEEAGRFINQRGHHTKKNWPGDHNPVVPAEVASMRIASPVKHTTITTKGINNTSLGVLDAAGAVTIIKPGEPIEYIRKPVSVTNR